MAVIDDTSPAVVYSSGWVPAGSASENAGTTHGTYEKGTTATVSFIGTFIEVRGTIEGTTTDPVHGSPNSTYTIDGKFMGWFSPRSQNETTFREVFFRSPTLQDGRHELRVESTLENSVFWLDYFIVPDASTSQAVFLTPASNPTSQLSLSPEVTSAVPLTNTGTRQQISTGAIVGIALSGACVLFCTIGTFLLLRYRHLSKVKNVTSEKNGGWTIDPMLRRNRTRKRPPSLALSLFTLSTPTPLLPLQEKEKSGFQSTAKDPVINPVQSQPVFTSDRRPRLKVHLPTIMSGSDIYTAQA